MDFGLQDKVALISGSAGGIEMAIARCLAGEGARVAIGYHTARDTAERLCAEIEGNGGQALSIPLELADSESIENAVTAVLRRWDQLDVLVASAWVAPTWVMPGTPPESTPMSVWHEQLRTNLEGTGALVRAVLPHMRSRGWGRIVFVSSGAAEDGAPGLEPYAAAKAALHGLGRSLARSVGPAGILVNVVMPGLIPTDRHRQTIPKEALDFVAGFTPTKHLATPEDVARVISFLSSTANGSVTGACVRVSGGLSGVVP